jgi:N-acetylglucosaminyl-diphospho-decaprenol L-rhamnosyltransferase
MPAAAAAELSILIVNWNGQALLRRLLESIEQTREGLSIEIIVVDNASSDGSAEMIIRDFPGVCLVRNTTNLGFARANNQAAGIASAPIFLLLNNDTLVYPSALCTLVRYLHGHPEVVAVGPKLIGSDGKQIRSSRNLPTLAALLNSIQFLRWTGLFRSPYRRYRTVDCDMTHGGPVAQLDAASLAIRKDAFERCSGFDEGYEFGVEDVDLCARLANQAMIYYLPDASIEHIGRMSSRANRNMVNRGYLCGWARYLRKHHSHAASLFYKAMVTLDMPVRIIVLGLQWAHQRVRNRTQRSQRTRERFLATTWFAATSLPRFWMS